MRTFRFFSDGSFEQTAGDLDIINSYIDSDNTFVIVYDPNYVDMMNNYFVYVNNGAYKKEYYVNVVKQDPENHTVRLAYVKPNSFDPPYPSWKDIVQSTGYLLPHQGVLMYLDLGFVVSSYTINLPRNNPGTFDFVQTIMTTQGSRVNEDGTKPTLETDKELNNVAYRGWTGLSNEDGWYKFGVEVSTTNTLLRL